MLARLLMRYAPLCFAILVLLSACGSHHTAFPRVVAQVSGDTISAGELNEYMRYAAIFDSVVYPDSSEASCVRSVSSPTCANFRVGVLARLIEERTVLAYAARNHISLSASDRLAARAQLRAMMAPSAPTARLFYTGVSRDFVSQVVQRQLLIQRVEERVVGRAARRGLEYRIRKIGIPSSGNAGADTRRLLQIATSGTLPADAAERTEWMAPFRMKPAVRRALAVAQPGEYVGPFTRPGYLLLIQLLARRSHRYASAAHQVITSRLFGRWLAGAVAAAHPRCLDHRGFMAPCPSTVMKTA